MHYLKLTARRLQSNDSVKKRATRAQKIAEVASKWNPDLRNYDVDGNVYIDYVGSWGPMILGHSHPEVVKALSLALENGTSFGAPTELEVKMAELGSGKFFCPESGEDFREYSGLGMGYKIEKELHLRR